MSRGRRCPSRLVGSNLLLPPHFVMDAPLVGFMHPQLDVVAGGDFPLFRHVVFALEVDQVVDALPGATGDGQIDILQLTG